MRSSSSISTISTWRKCQEALTFLRWRLAEGSDLEGFNRMFQQINRDINTYQKFSGKSIKDACVLEIGYGARPFVMIALMSMGIDVRGIDLDRPMLYFSVGELLRIWRRNGIERMLKTAGRNVLFDRQDRRKLARAISLRGYSPRLDWSRFLVGDAATYDFRGDRFDFIYSHDVFEHVPLQQLPTLIEQLASLLTSAGIAVIAPNCFPGITGNHLPEWYTDKVELDIPRESEPWEHLRKKRFQANTYLNQLSRSDYRAIFGRHFRILREAPLVADQGRRWLTPEIREELAQWSDEELFSNTVEFVLRRK